MPFITITLVSLFLSSWWDTSDLMSMVIWCIEMYKRPVPHYMQFVDKFQPISFSSWCAPLSLLSFCCRSSFWCSRPGQTNFSLCLIFHLLLYIPYLVIYLSWPIAKDRGEDGRWEEGDDGQQDCHAGWISKDVFVSSKKMLILKVQFNVLQCWRMR